MAYQDIPPLKLLLALAIACVPILVLDETGSDKWAQRYAAVVLLGVVIAHWRGLEQFAAWVRHTLGG
jgi:hypothetical protein